MKKIYSNYGSCVNQISYGKTLKIGEIREDILIMNNEGSMKPCTLLIWDFYGDGNRDYFYFSDEKQLLFSMLSESRNDYLVRLYSDLVLRGTTLEAMVSTVRNEFIV